MSTLSINPHDSKQKLTTAQQIDEMNKANAKKRRDDKRAAEERKRQEAAAQLAREQELARERQRQEANRINEEQIRILLEDEGKEEFKNANACDVCYSDFLLDGSDETLTCGHVVCAKCYRKYIDTEIKSKGKRDFSCLEC